MFILTKAPQRYVNDMNLTVELAAAVKPLRPYMRVNQVVTSSFGYPMGGQVTWSLKVEKLIVYLKPL
jgi:hypothetical protein